MSKKIVFVFLTGMVLGSGVNFLINHTRREQTTIVASKPMIKEIPDMVVQAQVLANLQNTAEILKKELFEKHKFRVYDTYPTTPDEYCVFLKTMLANPDIANQLGSYNVDYWATNEFEVNRNGIRIDISHSPRQILEYIQTH